MLIFPIHIRYLLILLLVISSNTSAKESICYGTTSNGKLEGGVQLPSKGRNFIGYSRVAAMAGRTYVHSAVKNIIIAAYKDLETEQPKKVYKYAETGFSGGGQFRPHKTHRNGLSVDFMTPVINANDESVHLPTHVFNKFGYNIEFDSKGNYKGLTIDYEALAAHIVVLHKQAKRSGNDLWRVIFDPKLQVNLFKTKYADYLEKHITFSKKRSWVRHDEHYHIDFVVACKQ